MWLDGMVDEAYEGLLQILAICVLDDKARKAHPELAERGFTQDWAYEAKRSLKEKEFRQGAVKLILKYPDMVSCHDAEFAIVAAQILDGCSIEDLNQASRDLEIMLKHYSQGEGEDVDADDGAQKMLMTVGHSETVARVTASNTRVAFLRAHMKRMYMKGEQKQDDVYVCGNDRFVRKEAYMGLRPWVYAGKVDESKPGMDEEYLRVFLHEHNMVDKPTEGRWSVFQQDGSGSEG